MNKTVGPQTSAGLKPGSEKDPTAVHVRESILSNDCVVTYFGYDAEKVVVVFTLPTGHKIEVNIINYGGPIGSKLNVRCLNGILAALPQSSNSLGIVASGF